MTSEGLWRRKPRPYPFSEGLKPKLAPEPEAAALTTRLPGVSTEGESRTCDRHAGSAGPHLPGYSTRGQHVCSESRVTGTASATADTSLGKSQVRYRGALVSFHRTGSEICKLTRP